MGTHLHRRKFKSTTPSRSYKRKWRQKERELRVNQAFTLQMMGGVNPIGHRIRHDDPAPWATIVGVVNDIRCGGKDQQVTPQVYFSAAQTALYPVSLADFAVRTAGDPRQAVNAVQAQVWVLDKDQPVTGGTRSKRS